MTRTDIINLLIQKNNYKKYLEIGVYKGHSYNGVLADIKDSVDPDKDSPAIYHLTSDDFFNKIAPTLDYKYDVIFIDGLHHTDQVDKDIENSLKHIVDKGFIILHDCNPSSYDTQLIPRQTIAWTGDVWKAFVDFKINNPLYPSYVIDTDFGVGIIQNISSIKSTFINNDISWDQFNNNKKQLLNLMSWEEFKIQYNEKN